MIKRKIICALLFGCCLFGSTKAQKNPFAEYPHLFTPPLHYVAAYTSTPPDIDGVINDAAWKQTEWTSYFQDIEGDLKPNPYYQTRAKMLWDKDYLYIAAHLSDPHVWGTLTKRDQVVFFDNDFEVFIDPRNTTHCYFEIEVNALNNIFDLFLPKPYRAGGSALFAWDTPGMKHAVKIHGTINDPSDTDEGWTVEFAIPFSALTLGNDVHVPKDGETWRINFSRVQWDTDIVDGKYVKRKDANGKGLPENNWVWSPIGVIDMHRPERWGYLQFVQNEIGSALPAFQLPYGEQQRRYLWLVYYKQKDYMQKNKRYAKSLAELGLKDRDIQDIQIDGNVNKLQLWSSDQQFKATIADDKGNTITINDEGLVRQ